MSDHILMRYLVTGGAGFIGSHLAEALVKKGDPVVILDDLSSGKLENLANIFSKIQFIKGDVRDPDVVAEAMKGVDVVFHEAAVGSVPKSVIDPMGSHHANVTGTLEVLWAAQKAKVRRLVNAASSSAYGDAAELPKRESMLANPLSPYAATKLAQENYCRAFAVSYGIETVSLRYFNVYGPRQDPTSQYAAVVPKFFQEFLCGKAPVIFGDGEQTRDFTYVEDVVNANLRAAECSHAKGEVFNIAGGRQISINALAQKIAQLVGSDRRPIYEQPRIGDVRHSLADVSAARMSLGWTPSVPLEEGLCRTHDWYRQNGKDYVPTE